MTARNRAAHVATTDRKDYEEHMISKIKDRKIRFLAHINTSLGRGSPSNIQADAGLTSSSEEAFRDFFT